MRNRPLYSIGLTILLLFTVYVIAIIAQSMSDRHTEYSYFYEALDELPETHEIVTWTDDQPKGRTLEENNKYDLALKITESWEAYALAMDKGNSNVLKDYFATTALERSTWVLESDPERRANMVMMGMTVDPQVYHLDGSLFQFRSDDAVYVRYLIDGERLSAFSLTKDCILTNLILRQSGWKIANHERDCSEDLPIRPSTLPWDLPPLKGINYYPKNSPWSGFWKDYDKAIIAEDIEKITDLGANSVRIFLNVDDFTRSDSAKRSIENLENFLEQTQDASIYVIPTLFDFRGDLSPHTWPADRYYLDRVLPILASASNVAYVDLKNEIDLDEGYQNPALVEAWIRTIIGVARDIAPELKYSIGWSNAENATRYASLLDVISYHEYGDAKDSKLNFERVKIAANSKPVIVSEIGETSYDLTLGMPSNLKKQAKHLQTRLDQLSASDGVLVWSLYDYPDLDPKAVSGSFWHKGIQKNFGLFNKFDQIKPAAQVFKEWKLHVE